jgi:hypothetical protein
MLELIKVVTVLIWLTMSMQFNYMQKNKHPPPKYWEMQKSIIIDEQYILLYTADSTAVCNKDYRDKQIPDEHVQQLILRLDGL